MKYKFIIAFREADSFSTPKIYIRVVEDWHSETMDALFDNDYKTDKCSVATWVKQYSECKETCHEILTEEDLIDFQFLLNTKTGKQ